MAEMTKEEITQMVNSVVNETFSPIMERIKHIGGTEHEEKQKEQEEPEEISDAVKQYIADKKNGTFGGRVVEAPNKCSYSRIGGSPLDLRTTNDNDSVLTGKEI